MRKKAVLALVLVLAMVLVGCSPLVPSEYSQLTPHVRPSAPLEEPSGDPRIISSQSELRQAISDFIRTWTEHGVIRVYSYPGPLEEDLSAVAYEVSREDPYGAYVVDYVTHSCSLIVSYYEIKVDITYRDDVVRPEELTQVMSISSAQLAIEEALDRYEQRLVLDMSYYYTPVDVEAMVARHCAARPAQLMAVPEVSYDLYPENGQHRILDIRFSWPHEADVLLEMEQAVADSLNAASVYVRYRNNDREKAELLFTYLMERFPYKSAVSQTPVYAFLCQGLGSSQSAAVSWQLLCDEAGLECHTISGLRGGSEYWWNILCLDGMYCHVDIFRNLLENSTLQTYSDSTMTDYYWDTTQFPVCPDPEPEAPEAPIDQETDPGETDEPGTPDDQPPAQDQPSQEESPVDLPSEEPDQSEADEGE